MLLEFSRLRFRFRAEDAVRFPAATPANLLRGALGGALKRLACVPECSDARTCPRRGVCAYARLFEPAAEGSGPSGLADRPRPFVFRARHLGGILVPAGGAFHFDVHLFDRDEAAGREFVRAFAEVAHEGLGPRRGRAVLVSADSEIVRLGIAPPATAPRRIRVRFLTPTELKAGERLAERPEFAVLFARARDRVATLRALYGPGPPEADFRGLGERAGAVRMAECEIVPVRAERRSARTGTVHPLGGFTGHAVYEGDLGEFLPYLQAAAWTGVGRQTVWGKGEIRVEPADASNQ